MLSSKSLFFRCMAVSVFILTYGCQTYSSQTSAMRSSYRGGDFKEAMTRLENLDVAKDGKRSLLYRLEKSMIADRQNNHRESRKLLLEADKITDDLFTKSVSKTAGSMVINDMTADYEPEDFEKVAIHTQLALSFIETNEMQSARVSARKINTRLAEINKQYEEEEKLPKYTQDAFALFLSGLIYESRGEIDDAIIDYKKAYGLYRDSYNWFVPEMPMQLVNSYYGVLLKRNRRTEIEKVLKDYPKLKDDYQKPASSTGELIAIFEVGTIAPKETSEHFIPIAGQLIRFSFPRIAYTSGFVGKTGVDIIGPKKMEVAGEQVQNLSKIAYYNLEERATRTALKATARIVAKGVAVGAVHRRYGALAGLAANLLAAASETADTRGWNLLPGYYYLVRQTLPAGNYKLKPFINNEDGKTQEVVIKSGQFSFVRFK